MHINILDVVIIGGSGADKVYLSTDLPSGIVGDEENLCLTFSVAKGEGQNYVKRHFPNIPVDIIERL